MPANSIVKFFLEYSSQTETQDGGVTMISLIVPCLLLLILRCSSINFVAMDSS